MNTLQWRRGGHKMRQPDNRLNKKMQDWRPWLGKRSRGRPRTRWKDDLKLTASLAWTREAQDRDKWRILDVRRLYKKNRLLIINERIRRIFPK